MSHRKRERALGSQPFNGRTPTQTQTRRHLPSPARASMVQRASVKAQGVPQLPARVPLPSMTSWPFIYCIFFCFPSWTKIHTLWRGGCPFLRQLPFFQISTPTSFAFPTLHFAFPSSSSPCTESHRSLCYHSAFLPSSPRSLLSVVLTRGPALPASVVLPRYVGKSRQSTHKYVTPACLSSDLPSNSRRKRFTMFCSTPLFFLGAVPSNPCCRSKPFFLNILLSNGS